MKIVEFVAEADPEKCTGDGRCERLCPGGAIRVVGKRAVVDADRCVACGKCAEVCREDAVALVFRKEPLTIRFDVGSVDRQSVQSLCARAGFLPDLPLCACTGTTVGEIAAAIVGGAKTPEDVVVRTGAGSGCGIYCMAVIFKLFACEGMQLPKNPRWNQLPLASRDIPEEVAAKYPEYHFDSLT
jgi:NAD-dependent dihydropyrimidine dehydrogenase PreA subunit/bacterioferritin-associated ferredoxin